jgi:hypothetical protein
LAGDTSLYFLVALSKAFNEGSGVYSGVYSASDLADALEFMFRYLLGFLMSSPALKKEKSPY